MSEEAPDDETHAGAHGAASSIRARSSSAEHGVDMHPLVPGDTLLGGRYRIRRRLGEGGMGVVYEALDAQDERTVALKTLTQLDAAGVYRMKAEFRSLADVIHPNLVRLYELHADHGRWFFTMGLVAGKTFDAHVRGKSDLEFDATMSVASFDPERSRDLAPERGVASAAFDERKLRQCLAQLVSGVDAIHRAGKLHRDLKPSNVLVTPDGGVVVLDFGLVSERNEELASGRTIREETFSGTPAYMAPEQFRGERPTTASDWYAVGVMVYEALTGIHPFGGNVLQLVATKQTGPIPEPAKQVAGVPDDLNRLCVDLLDRDPSRRPDAAAILQRLGVDAHSSPLASHPSAADTGMDGSVVPLIGRETELASLEQLLAATDAGAPCVALVMGASGMGKTALVEHFLRQLERAGNVVMLTGRCYEREIVPYKAVDGIIDALTRHLRRLADAEAARLLPRNVHALCRLFPVLERVPVIADTPRRTSLPSDPAEIRRLGFDALGELLARITDGSRLVLSVDDLQWGDADSFHLLDAILGTPDPPALLLVGTCRAEESEHGPLVRELLDPRRGIRNLRVATIAVAPLDTSQVETLIDALAPGLGGLSSDAIRAESQGNPFLITELVRFAMTSGSTDKGVDIHSALAARVEALPAPTRSLLDVIALAGRPLDRATAATACGTDRAAVTEAFEVLRVAGLASTFVGGDEDASRHRLMTTYHDQIRTSVVRRMSEDERRAGHRRLGEALAVTEHPDPEVISHHFIEAGDFHLAGRYALQAAERADDGLAFERTAMLYRIALDHGETEADERLGLCVQLAVALQRAGRDSDAATAFLEAARLASGAEHTALRRDCQRRAAEQLTLSGDLEEGMRVLSTVLAEFNVRLPRSPQRALVQLVWDRIVLAFRGLDWSPREEADASSEELALLDAYRVVVLALALIHPIFGLQFLTRYVLVALRSGVPTHVTHALGQYGGTLATSGRRGYRRGLRFLEVSKVASQLAAEDEREIWGHVQVGQYGLASLLCGDFVDAEAKLAVSVTAALQPFRHMAGMGLARNLQALLYLGVLRYTRPREFLNRFDVLLRDAVRRGDRYTEATATRLLNVAWLMRDEPLEARAALDRVTWAPLEHGFHLQSSYELRARIELDLYTNGPEDLVVRYEPELRAFDRSLIHGIQIERLLMRVARIRLLLHNAEWDIDRLRATSRASKLLRSLSKCESPIVEILATLLDAAVEVQRGNAEGARARLEACVSNPEGSLMTAMLARYRMGPLVGGDAGNALTAEAVAWAQGEGIVDLDRLAYAIAPGFSRRSARPALTHGA